MVLRCPQGLSFSPLLWNLFQNDMSLHINNANLCMHADEYQIYVMGKEAFQTLFPTASLMFTAAKLFHLVI